MFTGNYREDLATAKKLGIIKGNPKKEMLYSTIQKYEIDSIPEAQRISEIDLLDELITLCNTENDVSDRVSLLPKPVLKRDLKPVSKPILKKDRKIAPRPKLNKANRNYI